MLSSRKHALVTALALASLASGAQAVLDDVDRGPYTAATGYFPLYYIDKTGLTLDLCLAKTVSSRVAGAPGAPSYMCTLLPNPGIFDDALPIVFPFNWPDEAFWFTGDAAVVGQGIDLTYVSAIEAAFAGGDPVPGDQVSFSRVRIRMDLNVNQPGCYRITHPYGVYDQNIAAPGRRVINITRDIGIGAPGDFTGALNGDVGPFLRSVNLPAPVAPCTTNAYREINPETGAAECYIGDPNLLEPVTGSAFNDALGNPQNYVRVQRFPSGTGNPTVCQGAPTGIDVQTNQFAVSGRIWNGQRPTNVEVERATYTRTVDPVTFLVDTKLDVFASTPDSTTASACFRETIALVPGTPPSPCLFDMTPDGAGSFFAQDANPLVVPPFLIVTATDTGKTTPTPLAAALTDMVTVTRAQYSQNTGTLIVEAGSSDQANVPALVAVGLGKLSVLPGTVGIGSQRLQVQNLPEPPANVIVVSSAGGRDVEPVVVLAAAPVNANPVANPDTATTAEDTAVLIAVLANDTDADGDSLTITGVTGVSNGSTAIVGTSVRFTPTPNFNGTGGFNYTISDGKGGVASAAVTVTVTPVNDAPVITSQPVTGATIGIAYSYDVNATDLDGDTLTYSLDGTPPAGNPAMTINPTTGVISWTPTAAQTGANPVTVRVTDNGTTNGAPAPLSATQTFTITVGAGVDYDISRFSVSGNVRTGRVGTISLRFTNAGTVQALRTATVTGTQVGNPTVPFYSQSLQISAAPGRTVTVSFPNFLPTRTGTINWTVLIDDDNADNDTATATTTVPR